MLTSSVKQQLAVAFGALALLMALLSAVALAGLGAANDRFTGYIEGVQRRDGLALSIRVDANRRAMAVRDMVLVRSPKELEAAKSAAVKAHERLQAALAALQANVAASPSATPRDLELVAAMARIESSYAPVALAIVDLASAGQRDAAIDKMASDCRPLLESLLAAAADYNGYTTEQSARATAEAAAAFDAQRLWLGALSAGAVVVAGLLGVLIIRRLIGALGAEPALLSAAAQRVANGDLGPLAGAATAPPRSVLASMGAMQAQLVGLIGQVRASADNIATASAQLAQGNSDLSGRTEQQATALQQTTVSVEELHATVHQNADNARRADELAKASSAVAVRGGDVVGQVVATMKDINDSSRRIADITGVIDAIAFQTNILALNAAVEAARAGEQGRGFAVVASEVRSLAGRSSEAAREIKDLIGASVERVGQGSLLVDQAGTTMAEIVTAIERVTAIMADISAASSQQRTGVTQIGEAVAQMDRATQQNSALVEQSTAAAESMLGQAGRLVEAVARFRLEAAPAAVAV